MAHDWTRNITSAFHADHILQRRILDVAHRYQGELPALFGDIASYILSEQQRLQQFQQATPSAAPNDASKKRKLDNASQPAPLNSNGTAHPTSISDPKITFECSNVSFQIPARKKLKLQLVADPVDARRREMRLIDPKTGDTEHALSNGEIEEIFCLPVPEKQQRQWNFCIIPQDVASGSGGIPLEQMVFTLNETSPDDAVSSSRSKIEGDTYISVTELELNQLMSPLGKHVVKPTEAEFASSVPQSHRKGEKAYHVKAHRGTKEGYLFMLPNGVVFGFKKPLSFFPFSSIESISYTSVLQRTFNLVIATSSGDSAEVKETEFGMLDQADFGGIDEYVKRHGLNDASMAAQRKAKAYNVNKIPKGEVSSQAGAAPAEGEDEQTELQKAEQQLQDEEDELEEDYEASGGESDGEGEESDDYDEADGEQYEMEDEEEDEGPGEEDNR